MHVNVNVPYPQKWTILHLCISSSSCRVVKERALKKEQEQQQLLQKCKATQRNVCTVPFLPFTFTCTHVHLASVAEEMEGKKKRKKINLLCKSSRRSMDKSPLMSYGRRGMVAEESHLEIQTVTEGIARKSKVQDRGEARFRRRPEEPGRLMSLSLEEPEELGDTAVIDIGMAFVKVCTCVCVCLRVCTCVSWYHYCI